MHVAGIRGRNNNSNGQVIAGATINYNLGNDTETVGSVAQSYDPSASQSSYNGTDFTPTQGSSVVTGGGTPGIGGGTVAG